MRLRVVLATCVLGIALACTNNWTPTVAPEYPYPDYWHIEKGHEQDFAKDWVECMDRKSEIKGDWSYMGACLETKGWKPL